MHFKIYRSANELPTDWDDFAIQNIFLSQEYLAVLDKSAPANMTCHYIGFFENDALCGIAVSQFINLNQLRSFGDRDKRVKSLLRNFIFKNLNSHVLFIGNNMLTGQNAFQFSEQISSSAAIVQLKIAADQLKSIFKKQGKPVHIVTFKDFDQREVPTLETTLKNFYKFSIHPNMVFDVAPQWRTFDDYINALNKKYRDQYKRSLKRSASVIRRKMHLSDIVAHQETIYSLYLHVAENAPFNTFFLAKNHFAELKSALGENFKFYGYFENDKLIGFNTLIKNKSALDTYFLGYDNELQREKMLYLTMLYDMIGYAIKKEFKTIVFARTALEIKSSVGAKPITMYGLLQHTNPMLQKNMKTLFNYFEPKIDWQPRQPFK